MSAGGLWDAVIWMPAAASTCRTAKASTGVGSGRGNNTTLNPSAARTSAAPCANFSDPWRASRPTTTVEPPRHRFLRTLASP
ncbi:Uncharacterised protein [Mycobacteroides abscessus subsp. abscessus]|nr:Uncharacterised protein [Mycobacteroides abscessus subsp. abscessus]